MARRGHGLLSTTLHCGPRATEQIAESAVQPESKTAVEKQNKTGRDKSGKKQPIWAARLLCTASKTKAVAAQQQRQKEKGRQRPFPLLSRRDTDIPTLQRQWPADSGAWPIAGNGCCHRLLSSPGAMAGQSGVRITRRPEHDALRGTSPTSGPPPSLPVARDSSSLPTRHCPDTSSDRTRSSGRLSSVRCLRDTDWTRRSVTVSFFVFGDLNPLVRIPAALRVLDAASGSAR